MRASWCVLIAVGACGVRLARVLNAISCEVEEDVVERGPDDVGGSEAYSGVVEVAQVDGAEPRRRLRSER